MRNPVWYDESFCNWFSRAEFAELNARIKDLPLDVNQTRSVPGSPRAPLVLLQVNGSPYKARQFQFMLSEPPRLGDIHYSFEITWRGGKAEEWLSLEAKKSKALAVRRERVEYLPDGILELDARFTERTSSGLKLRKRVMVYDLPKGHSWELLAKEEITRAGNENYNFVRLVPPKHLPKRAEYNNRALI